jgi:hypothetical protein
MAVQVLRLSQLPFSAPMAIPTALSSERRLTMWLLTVLGRAALSTEATRAAIRRKKRMMYMLLIVGSICSGVGSS